MDRTPADSRGFTLVELVIGAGILALVIGAMYGMMSATSDATDATLVLSRLDQEAHRVVDRIADQLLQAGSSTLFPVPQAPLGGSSLQYRRASGYAAGAMQWSTLSEIAFRQSPQDAADGKDNDGDGLVDEGEVVLRTNVGQPNERLEILALGVAAHLAGETANGTDDNSNSLVDERGLSFCLEGSTLTIRLTLEARGPNGFVVRKTADTSVTLRN